MVKKHLLPDAVAALNWLKNRQKKLWRDKQEIGMTDQDGNDIAQPSQIIIIPSTTDDFEIKESE